MESEAADFPRFFLIESFEEICLTEFFPLLKEKVISLRATPRSMKKTRNSNLLVEVESQRHAKNIFKMIWFGLVSLFNGISTFVGYLMPKLFS